MGRPKRGKDRGPRYKRSDACLICDRRKCRTRVVRLEEPFYDEIACDEHQNALYLHSDDILGVGSGLDRHYISSTGNLRRGDPI